MEGGGLWHTISVVEEALAVEAARNDDGLWRQRRAGRFRDHRRDGLRQGHAGSGNGNEGGCLHCGDGVRDDFEEGMFGICVGVGVGV